MCVCVCVCVCVCGNICVPCGHAVVREVIFVLSFNSDLSEWDVSSVTDMVCGMFRERYRSTVTCLSGTCRE